MTPSSPGKYTFTGAYDLTGLNLTNPGGFTVTGQVTVRQDPRRGTGRAGACTQRNSHRPDDQLPGNGFRNGTKITTNGHRKSW